MDWGSPTVWGLALFYIYVMVMFGLIFWVVFAPWTSILPAILMIAVLFYNRGK